MRKKNKKLVTVLVVEWSGKSAWKRCWLSWKDDLEMKLILFVILIVWGYDSFLYTKNDRVGKPRVLSLH